MMLALVVATALLQIEGYEWSGNAEAMQYGVPETDDRALRIACRVGRGLELTGPGGLQGMENMPTQVTFRRGETSATLLGVTTFTGDGLSLAVPVRADDLPVATLLAGEILVMEQGEQSWRVPGAGAAALLQPLIAACPAPSRS